MKSSILIIIAISFLMFGCSSRYDIHGDEKFQLKSNGKTVKLFNDKESRRLSEILSNYSWKNNFVTYAPGVNDVYLLGNNVNLLIRDGYAIGQISDDLGMKSELDSEIIKILKMDR